MLMLSDVRDKLDHYIKVVGDKKLSEVGLDDWNGMYTCLTKPECIGLTYQGNKAKLVIHRLGGEQR